IGNRMMKALQSQQDWNTVALDTLVRGLMEKEGKEPRQFLGFLREAISGQRVTPPLFESMEILGKETVVKRLEENLQFIHENSEDSG
ncbi:MAG TPA: hypothetical protein PLL88_11865, partial [Anaerolineaceae bacterium]|nr:hypothetical protein [Anaerolineaceae bacterium]